ncbi:MAG: hypothetical protein WAU57_16170, partial [Xanthobacteraceae bacterium]
MGEVEAFPGLVPPTFELLYGPEFGESAFPRAVPPPDARHGFVCELLALEFLALPLPLTPAGPVPELSDDWPLFAEPDVAAPLGVEPDVADWLGVPIVPLLPVEPMVPLAPLALAPAAPPALAP